MLHHALCTIETRLAAGASVTESASGSDSIAEPRQRASSMWLCCLEPYKEHVGSQEEFMKTKNDDEYQDHVKLDPRETYLDPHCSPRQPSE